MSRLSIHLRKTFVAIRQSTHSQPIEQGDWALLVDIAQSLLPEAIFVAGTSKSSILTPVQTLLSLPELVASQTSRQIHRTTMLQALKHLALFQEPLHPLAHKSKGSRTLFTFCLRAFPRCVCPYVPQAYAE